MVMAKALAKAGGTDLLRETGTKAIGDVVHSSLTMTMTPVRVQPTAMTFYIAKDQSRHCQRDRINATSGVEADLHRQPTDQSEGKCIMMGHIDGGTEALTKVTWIPATTPALHPTMNLTIKGDGASHAVVRTVDVGIASIQHVTPMITVCLLEDKGGIAAVDPIVTRGRGGAMPISNGHEQADGDGERHADDINREKVCRSLHQNRPQLPREHKVQLELRGSLLTVALRVLHCRLVVRLIERESMVEHALSIASFRRVI